MKNLTFLLPILLVFSCTQDHEAPTDPTEQINANWEKFIEYWHSEDAEGCASFFHDDVIYLSPEWREIDNSADVAEFFNMLFNNHESSVYTHTTKMIDFCGQLAVEYSWFEVDWVTNEGEEWTYKGRMVVHWTADSEGNYKIKTLIVNQPEPEERDDADSIEENGEEF